MLRWVIGSCRAYLKETKPGEGVIQDLSSASGQYDHYYGRATGPIKQFTFVVGSPEQEDRFKNEIAEARRKSTHCEKYPTILAFHGESAPNYSCRYNTEGKGSGTERWHNILRTGLDYNETVCGRVSRVSAYKMVRLLTKTGVSVEWFGLF